MIKIISDGTSTGTQISDSETGKVIPYIKSCTLEFDMDKHFVTATLKMVAGFEIDAIAQIKLEDKK